MASFAAIGEAFAFFADWYQAAHVSRSAFVFKAEEAA
jgi:hypothetical protein